MRDPLWISFPRWIQESDIPRLLVEQTGLEGWIVFCKLVELDCETNLTPDWFSFTVDKLVHWTGLQPDFINQALNGLTNKGWIARNNIELKVQDARISTPLPITIDEDEIRQRLAGQEVGGRFVLRYLHNLGMMEKVERVIFLYQMIFGARFSPRIVDDLEEIANTYPMDIIYQVFQEAFQKKVKTLSWVKTHLPGAAEG